MINTIWKIQHCLLYGSLVGPEVEKEHNVLKWLKSLGLPIYPQEISFVKKFDRDLVGVKRSFIILKQSCTSGSGIQNSESRYWISQIPLNPQIELKPNLAELDFSVRYGGRNSKSRSRVWKKGVNIKDLVVQESESTKLFILNKIEELMKRGELVPVHIVLELITEAMIAHLDKSEGFLIDGYPRNVNQVSHSGLYYKI